MASEGYVLPTKIYLMELRKKLKLVEFSKRILEKKRDSLQSTIKRTMDEAREVVMFLKKELIEMIKFIMVIYLMYEKEIKAYALAQKERLGVEVDYMAERGIIVPYFSITERPKIESGLPEGVRSIMRRLNDALPDLMKLASIFLKIELLLRELEVTNRIVNTLDKVIIPDIRDKISYITSMLSEFFISELSSLRVITSEGED